MPTPQKRRPDNDGAKDRIAQIELGRSSGQMTCARFTVLGKYIDHHVEEDAGSLDARPLCRYCPKNALMLSNTRIIVSAPDYKRRGNS